ncbi:MAG: hypothetical protein IJW45_04670 [Oscillospiraceae bacterium]|nr:hypothetical protein [Oscillospiraceae bacterium]
MNCMKCGREIPLGQVFCKDCLADMQTHPVKPGTPIVLPSHESVPTQRRTNVRRTRKPEEQIGLLRKLLIGVSLVLVAVSIAFAITTAVLLERIERGSTTSRPGQNYSTEATEP